MTRIENLLQLAYNSPKYLSRTDGADALVLSLHCLLVEQGYVSLGGAKQPVLKLRVPLEEGVNKAPVYTPPKDWNVFEDEWVVIYARAGSPSVFRLHCALQAATGRLFVHASELEENGVPKPSNIQVLGLQLLNYVNTDREDSSSWEGIVTNERTMIDMFNEFVGNPLWSSAIKCTTEETDIREDTQNHADSPESICAGPNASLFAKGRGALSKTNVTFLPTSYLTYSPALSGLVIGCAALGAACYMLCLRRGQSAASSSK